MVHRTVKQLTVWVSTSLLRRRRRQVHNLANEEHYGQLKWLDGPLEKK